MGDLTLTMLKPDLRTTRRMTARDWHVVLCGATPHQSDQTPDVPHRLLWAHPRPDLIIVQAAGPTNSRMLYGVAEVVGTAEVARYRAGDRVAVSGVVNPRRTSRRGEVRTTSLIPPEVWDDWAARRFPEAAATVHRANLSPDRTVTFRRTGRQQVTLTRTWLRAEVTIGDPDEFRTLLASGVGSGKAYGCGLLIARPA